MLKKQWVLLASWVVETKHRVIFKTREKGSSLIDITIDNKNIDGIIHEVLHSSWTIEELMDYLNKTDMPQFNLEVNHPH
jgi:hypothetical protein